MSFKIYFLYLDRCLLIYTKQYLAFYDMTHSSLITLSLFHPQLKTYTSLSPISRSKLKLKEFPSDLTQI